MMDAVGMLVALVALGLGALIGFLIASRQAAAAKQVTESLRLQLDGVGRERESAFQELGALRNAHSEAQAKLAALQAAQQERERGFEQQIASLEKAKETLVVQFREIGDKLLEKAQSDFLAKADDRLAKADKEQTAKLQQLLQPVESTLKRYEEGLQRVEKDRIDSYAGLREQVELVRAGQGQVRDEARRLVTALTSSPKQRGRWGERSLQNVLVQAGLVEGIDFNMEVSTDGEEGRLRPDAIVNLPQGRKLVIDAKCSLNAYLDACDEVDDDRRTACFKAHLASVLRHAQQLGSKNYWAQFGDAADFVIMYIPGEHFLSAALEQDEQLWEKAFKDKVLLATPTNLVAIARTVASVWRQERLAEAAEEIASIGKELHSRIATMADHIARMGKNLATANTAYNQMVGSFESQVLTQARRFEGLGAGSAKEAVSPPMMEAAPRPLTKLVGPSGNSPAANEE
ncbi:DNA recombination protein RmuC [Sphingomonas piscis]|uniref:DNA recombination protein RmuC homolog n=1 Tax=Sphingomonas piscis TaxID=2714943 RepID=A0A6G7YSS9_9SPHN|nr:DNA recombination protein RmuC [Sphingomonas piscis]QIK79781.1 DNA recombination protein RmuC [Sphingomonas piscis]